MDFRAGATVDAIGDAIANGGTLPEPERSQASAAAAQPGGQQVTPRQRPEPDPRDMEVVGAPPIPITVRTRRTPYRQWRRLGSGR